MIQRRRYRRSPRAVLLLVAPFLAASCGDTNDPSPEPSPFVRIVPEVDDPPVVSRSGSAKALTPVEFGDAVRPLRLEFQTSPGYIDANGELVLDVLEGEPVYPTLSIRDAEGRPVRGVRPEVTPARESLVMPRAGGPAVSDHAGNYTFGLLAGSMGEERVEVVVGSAVTSLLLNVISQRAAGYDWLGDIEGVLDWGLLSQADVQWGEHWLSATFPDEVTARRGQTVKLAGFMMPLETANEQSHFVLTSSPPDCFFHLPGGPAGAVEVFTAEPVEVSWDPIVLEGRFEALETSEIGVIYRLREARAHPTPRLPGP